MAEITDMLHFFIITYISFFEIIKHTKKNLIHIFMDKLTVSCCQYIISTSFFMKTER